jgi:hypothetical protein
MVRTTLLIAALVAACGQSSSGGGTCSSVSGPIATGESNGMGGFTVTLSCPDAIARQVRCVSTVAGNPSTAPMSCACTASGSPDRTFNLPPDGRGHVSPSPAATAFWGAQCGWSLPAP